MTSHAWFHGPISREQSMALLLHFPEGAFLVRCSSRPRCFSLDLVAPGGRFLPLLVRAEPERGPEAVSLEAPPQSGLQPGRYASLAEMVEANRRVLKVPCNKTEAEEARPVHVELKEETSHREEHFNAFAQGIAARGFDSGAPKLRREGSEEGEMLMATGGLGGGKNKREGDEECQFLMGRPDI